jgi:hypothetical protein
MACLLTSGIAKGCKDSIGGLITTYIANKKEVTGVTPDYLTDTTGLITGCTLSAATYFYEFEIPKVSSSYTDVPTANNYGCYFEQTLTIVIPKNAAAVRNKVQQLASGEYVVIVKDFNGKYFMLGEVNGVELNGGSGGSGTAAADLNGYTLTINGQSPIPVREVESSIISAITQNT